MDYSVLSSAEHGARFSGWMKAYGALPASEKAMWEMKRRSHLAMQPYIRDVIVDALIRNPRESWRELEVDVNFWCSYSAIRRWIMSREGFRYYAERIIPLLTTHQMEKHLAFARKFRNNGGLGGGKFLLVMFDEKWFWGLVLRSYAKQVAEFIIVPRSFSRHITEITSTSAWWWLSLPWLLLTALRMAALRSSLDFFGLRRIKLRGRW